MSYEENWQLEKEESEGGRERERWSEGREGTEIDHKKGGR